MDRDGLILVRVEFHLQLPVFPVLSTYQMVGVVVIHHGRTGKTSTLNKED